MSLWLPLVSMLCTLGVTITPHAAVGTCGEANEVGVAAAHPDVSTGCLVNRPRTQWATKVNGVQEWHRNEYTMPVPSPSPR